MNCALIAPAPDSYEETIHNYVEIGEKIILRKGAISAKKDEKVMIPLNMRDGIIIGKGKGLEDWNESAPHGAGRVLSRGQAKRQLSVDIFKDQMEGIYSTCINESTLDESPSAYKNSDEICNNLDSVEIVGRTKPIYNIKA
jgi:RNA-splicing ligase RtcB|nr:MAG TPA: tRNA-splicing ligase RtcB [Caudoviricetes sp.]